MKRSQHTDEQILAIVKEGEAGRKVLQPPHAEGETCPRHATSAASSVHHCSTAADSAATESTMPSPNAMMAKGPWRSAT
jgi:hypothetical protein